MSAAGHGPENRTQVRAPIELKVEYKKLNTFFSDYTKNISKGGTFIRTDRPLPIGTEFVFNLLVPLREAPFTLRGQVAWVRVEDDLDNEGRGMGIRFLWTEDDLRRDFESVVEALMSDHLGPTISRRLIDSTR